jgi:hypothetical protein
VKLFLLRLAVTGISAVAQGVSGGAAFIFIILFIEGLPHAIVGGVFVGALCALVIVESAVPAVVVLGARTLFRTARVLSPLLASIGSGLGLLVGVGAVLEFPDFVDRTGLSFGLMSRGELDYTLILPPLGSSLGILAGTLIRRKPRAPAPEA